MASAKFFYKYQSIEKVKEKNGNDRKYVVGNLVNTVSTSRYRIY